MSSPIVVQNLTKLYRIHHKEPGLKGSLKSLFQRTYEDKLAIDNLNFEIGENELVGFIGPNGAGKTTTLKILAGLLYPSQGSARVLGFDPWQRNYQFLTQISLIMGQKNQLWWDLPAAESFKLAKDIYSIPDKKYHQTLDNLIEMLDLGDKLDVQVRKLSLGERMKAELVAALLHQPKILFLDEPTIGLDVVMQKKIRQFIKDYKEEFKGSIILTSHYMEDVKELCQRVIIISEGKIVYDGLLEDVVQKYASHKQIEVTLKDGTIRTYKAPRSKVAKRAQQILEQHPVTDLTIKEPDLQDVIRDVFENG